MLNKLSHKISNWLVRNGADKNAEAVYAYGIECTLSTAIIIALLLASGLVLHKFLHILVYIAVWLPLRIFVGGSHANTHTVCTIISVGLGILSVLLTKYVNKLPFPAVLAIMAVSYIIILLLAPVVHKNHPISNSHRKKMQVVARLLGAVFCILICVLSYFEAEMMAPAFMGCMTTVVMAVTGYFSKSSIKKFE